MALATVDLVTPKAVAKHELLFHKPASEAEEGLLNIYVGLK
jgi:hypothetical protein